MPIQAHKILIVEDHEPTRRALSRLLAHRGWQVEIAATVAEGIEALGGEPECVILDLMLPDGDGEAVLQQVRERGMPTRVVVASGVGDASRLEAAGRMGAD